MLAAALPGGIGRPHAEATADRLFAGLINCDQGDHLPAESVIARIRNTR